MADVLIVGDGPAGLSAALFLAKKEQQVTLFGLNGTPMHKAMLYNYLGIDEITGSDFQRIGREQIQKFGATIEDVTVTGVEKTADGFAVTAENGVRKTGKYLILATGNNVPLAESLGVVKEKDRLRANEDGSTSIPGLYVVGRSTRFMKTQAIISAGQGAMAALEILSAEAGEDLHDFDFV